MFSRPVSGSRRIQRACRPVEAQFLSLVQFLPVNLDHTFPFKLCAMTLIVGVAVGGAGSYLSVRRFLDV